MGDSNSQRCLFRYRTHSTKRYRFPTSESRQTLISMKKNTDISKYVHLISFLKENGKDFSKESKITKTTQFLLEADGRTFMIKVALIMELVGACKHTELTNLHL
ncbi:hypothetical protein NQ317_012411 [Molorchus minor]|uniref:Uncharacterized protein n=1 Tax=Molorchus minor TaxID=1323400 RepID=A0ABQ9JIN0_9CUCU|nr:hypothetical protein NQ317_012411 [Molorchus minor]